MKPFGTLIKDIKKLNEVDPMLTELALSERRATSRCGELVESIALKQSRAWGESTKLTSQEICL